MNKKVFYFLCLLTLLFPSKLWAQEPYAVVTGYETNGQTLTFYYDDQKENRGGMEIGPFAEYDNRPWGGDQQLITEVVFDTSFAGYTELTSTAYWFASIASLNTINGIKNLKTDNVTDMREMFAGCMNLTSLDLSRFYTSNVTDMQYMFAGCDNLTTIYVGNGWDVSKVTNSDEMFSGCFNLKGGAGTEFNQGQMGVTYAHVDGGENNPGYLTYLEDLDARKEELNMLIGEIYERLMVIKEMLEEKDPNRAATELWETLNQLEEEDVEISLSLEDAQTEADLDDIEWKIDELEERVSQLYEEVENYGLIAEVEPYAVLSDNNTVLTFYYDGLKAARNGMSVEFEVHYDSNLKNYVSDAEWFENRENITSVVFDASFSNCTTIKSTAYWFYSCTNLSNITGIENLKTDNVTNMTYMFRGCSGLSSLDLSSFKTNNVTRMDCMFYNCSGLTSLDVSGFNTENVWNMEVMFYGCSGLTSLDVSGFNTENVTRMNSMFNGCSGLTSLDVGNFKTANVTSMNAMFSGCAGLMSLDVSGFNTENVTNMALMFGGCSGLTSLDVGNFKTANVTSMNAMFSGCAGLMSLDVSNFNTANVTNMSLMFRDCSGLTSLDVSNFNTANVTNMAAMFSGCSSLTTLDVSNFNTANVTSMSSMFSGCSSLTTLDVSNFNTSNVTNMSYMFLGCSGLTGLDVTNFNTEKVTDMGGMFNGCSGLTSLDVGNFNTANVTSMNAMFSGCAGLMSLDVSGFNTENVTNMGLMFGGCSGLTSLDVGNFNTANVTSMSSMFRGCSGLTSLDLSGFNTDNVTNMSQMFRSCFGLTTIYVGDGWSILQVTSSGDMFTACNKLVGGRGTTYDINHVDVTYAHVDGGTANPGYFTSMADIQSRKDELNMRIDQIYQHLEIIEAILQEKDPDQIATELWQTLNQLREEDIMVSEVLQEAQTVEALDDCEWKIEELEERVSQLHEEVENYGLIAEVEPYAVLSDNNTVLTFYYDDQKAARGGMSVGPFDNSTERGWYEACESITSVVFDNSFAECTTLTSTAYWFYGCSFLTTITDIQYLKTANVTNMGYMFSNCSGLASLDVSNFNTSNVTSMSSMFSGCSSFTVLDISGFKTDNVTNLRGMFYGCSSLTSLDVSGFNTENVTDMAYIFEGCSGLTSLDISGFKTENVTDMSYMFAGCSGLTSLDVSGFNTENVYGMEEMFSGCSGLTILDVSGFNTQKVSGFSGMFRGCSNLTNIDMNGFYTENMSGADVFDMSAMFYGCSSLTSLDLNGFQTNKWTDMHYMFYGCSGLSSLDLSGFKTNAWDMSYMFYGCSGLTSLDLGGFGTQDNIFEFETKDMSYMFYGCTSLNTIFIGDGWDTSELTNGGDEMFSGCYNLKGGAGTTYNANHIDITYAHVDGGENNPGYFTSRADIEERKAELEMRLSSIHHQLEEIEMILQEKDPNQKATGLWQGLHFLNEDFITIHAVLEDAQTVTDLDDCEHKITELEDEVAHLFEEVVNYSENTDPIAYGVFTNNMRKLTFYYDTNMGTHDEGFVIPWEQLLNSNEMNNARQTLEIIDFDPSFVGFNTLTTTGYLFSGCMNLMAINGLEYLVTDNMTDMREMFASCESLTELDLRTFNTSRVTMMWGMFQGCIHLTTIIVGPGWTTAALTDEGHEMFAGCNSLVGGLGTTYSDEHFNADYAHIDGGPSYPGYLTGTEEPVITEFEVDGIFYRVHDQAEHRVTVAHVMRAEEELYVPFEVEYARIHWIVTALGEMAFTDLEQVKVIGVPESIDSVSVNLFTHCPHLAAIIWNANVPLTATAMGQFNNPNLLLYIMNTANAPASVTNVIDMTTYMADKIVLSDAANGGNDFYCPEHFMAKEISYTHIYDQATQIGTCQGWESIVVPFDVQTYTHETKGEIYPISTLLDEQIELDGDKPFWLYAFTSNDEFVEAEQIRANTPYIISMPNDPAYWDDYILSGRVTFSAKGVEVYPTRNVISVESQSRVFVPNFENMDYENPDIFLLNVGDAYENHLPGSIFSGERPARRARPFEAYFIPTGNYPARYMDIFSSEVDAIHEIPMSSKTKEGIYDLMGRRVKSEEWRVEGNNSSTHQLQKGLYIIDGKKVMVK